MQQRLKCEFEIVLLRAEATNCAGVVFTIAIVVLFVFGKYCESVEKLRHADEKTFRGLKSFLPGCQDKTIGQLGKWWHWRRR